MTSIGLANLARRFGAVWAVRDVSLEVAEGEFFALLGPSGCGKTTTLRMIAGLETPTAGRVTFGADDVTDLPPQHRNVGLVFQSYAVFPTMTVAENVAYGLRIRRLTDDEIHRRTTDVLATVGLASLAGRMPGQLSGGQLQRVALARALAIRPRVLLLDEPLSNLDAKLRVEVRAEIKRLQRDLGITTVYVSHDQEEALSISDRIGVMNQGRLEQVGRPEEIYQRPATRFVAGFVGEGTMLEGQVNQDNRRRVIVGDRLEIAVTAVPSDAETVWVCVRPEAVRIVQPGSVEDGRAAITGVIEHVEFVGPSVRADLRVASLDRRLRLSAPAVDARAGLRLGAPLSVQIDPAGVAVGRRLAPSPDGHV